MNESRRFLLKAAAGGAATRLQEGYVGNQPSAVRALARLRRDGGRLPGDNALTWDTILLATPRSLRGEGDQPPTDAEYGVHAAMTLYALHQQGQRQLPMHVEKLGLGGAVRRLAGKRENEDAVLRRFQTLLGASSWEAVLHHLRGLITQLRGESIGLDYGMLAADLADYRTPSRAAAVRLRWGRGYYQHIPDGHDPAVGTPTEAPTPEDPSPLEQSGVQQ